MIGPHHAADEHHAQGNRERASRPLHDAREQIPAEVVRPQRMGQAGPQELIRPGHLGGAVGGPHITHQDE